jgi:hypothetical protein
MSMIRKIFLHCIVVIIVSLLFFILHNIGIHLLYYSSLISAEDRWKFNIPFLHLYTDVAVPYSVAGYILFLIAKYLLLKNRIKISNNLIGILSFVAMAFIITSFGFGLNLKDPFTINFIIVLILSGYLSSFLNKKLIHKLKKRPCCLG